MSRQGAPRELAELAQGLGFMYGHAQIACLVDDSRRVQPGDAYVCMPRSGVRAGEYVQMAAAQGAAAIIFVGVAGKTDLPYLHVQDIEQLGQLLRRWHGTEHHATQLIGVTGTDGKTSVCWMLRAALARQREHVWGCGTLGLIQDDTQIVDLGNTTPSLLRLHQLLADAEAQNVSHLVMEVSSHGIAQQRIAGLDFRAVIWTTIGHDHLQDHGGYMPYLETKAGFIQASEQAGATAIVNADHEDICRHVSDQALRYGRGLYRHDVAMAWEQELPGFVRLNNGTQEIVIEDIPAGEFHAENLACVATLLHYVENIPMAALPALLKGMSAPPGRMEAVETAADWQVFIDYAHTPEALARCLKTARMLTRQRLLLVFGCGGERDREKRPQMGRLAAELADAVWISSDNPRGEAPEVIASEIEFGMVQPYQAEIHLQLDREMAIAEAIDALQPGDTLVIAGKGHEDYMEVAGRRMPWSDREAAERYLEMKRESGRVSQCA